MSQESVRGAGAPRASQGRRAPAPRRTSYPDLSRVAYGPPDPWAEWDATPVRLGPNAATLETAGGTPTTTRGPGAEPPLPLFDKRGQS